MESFIQTFHYDDKVDDHPVVKASNKQVALLETRPINLHIYQQLAGAIHHTLNEEDRTMDPISDPIDFIYELHNRFEPLRNRIVKGDNEKAIIRTRKGISEADYIYNTGNMQKVELPSAGVDNSRIRITPSLLVDNDNLASALDRHQYPSFTPPVIEFPKPRKIDTKDIDMAVHTIKNPIHWDSTGYLSTSPNINVDNVMPLERRKPHVQSVHPQILSYSIDKRRKF